MAVLVDAEAHTGGWEALVELEGWSLVNRSGDAPLFTVHRLVQEVSRLWQQQPHTAHGLEAPEANELVTTLGWINAAFVGEPQDVRSWPVLEPLAPHALAVARHGDRSGFPVSTARLFSYVGVLLLSKAMHGEAEPLMRRVLAIDEASYGPEHPNVSRGLNNLAQPLHATNRLSEAEPLSKRHLLIFLAFLRQGFQHPHLQDAIGNYAALLSMMGHPEEDIQTKLKALFTDATGEII